MARPRTRTTPPPHVAPDAAEWVIERLRALDVALGETLPRVHGSLDEEALHDMRVAVRKLRVLLRIARPIFGRFHADAVRAPFTDVHRATSALRDEEVLEGTLDQVPVEDHPFGAWKKRRKARERALRKAALLRLERGDLERARQLLEALLALPVRPKRRGQLGVFARDCVERARRDVERLRDTPPSDAEGLHALRIAFKNLRYAIEMFAPILPSDVSAMGEPAKLFQQRLGELHDLDVAIDVAMRSKLSVPTKNKVLRALRAERAAQVERYLADAAPTIAPAPPTAPTPASVSTPAPARARAPTPATTKKKATRGRRRVILRGTLSRP